MAESFVHEIELYPFEAFMTLLNHEVHRARRYGNPVTLIHLAVETDASEPNAQHGAEVFTINALNIHLRDTDIPYRQGNEFLVLMPATNERGGRIVCERLEKLFHAEAQVYDKVSFKLFAFIGMATLSGDRSITSKMIMDHAAQALQHARSRHSQKTILFSEIQ